MKLTIGTPVHYFPTSMDIAARGMSVYKDTPCHGVVAYPHNERRANLSVIDHNGESYSLMNVLILQGDETYHPVTGYAKPVLPPSSSWGAIMENAKPTTKLVQDYGLPPELLK